MFYFKKFLKSFKHSFRGLKNALIWEQNLKIQLAISFMVIFLMFYFPTRNLEKVALILIITAVLILELINTIFERLSDILKPRIHDYVKDIKDIMAATVLVASICALIIGILILGPYISNFQWFDFAHHKLSIFNFQ
ncbi:diacylglycerol kinase [Candidatus Kuenenbacteria bacterium]|nr:diacylglycerol kinase [Candidatus Kuenenbacteria bacterium]